jgi:uncharacterized lipoprotein YmbA
MKRTVFLAVLAALIAGCSSGPGWKRQTFAFSAPAAQPVIATETNMVALRRVSISPLFQNRAFTYRTGENTYEQDPYASFLVAPDRALKEPLRASLAAFGRVLEPGSSLPATLDAEVTIAELYADFRDPARPAGRLAAHVVVYRPGAEGPTAVVFDKLCSAQSAMSAKTPAGLMAAWDSCLREINQQIRSEYAKASAADGGR